MAPSRSVRNRNDGSIHQALRFIAVLSLLPPASTVAWTAHPTSTNIHRSGSAWQPLLMLMKMGSVKALYLNGVAFASASASDVDVDVDVDGEISAATCNAEVSDAEKIPAGEYYNEYHGHTTPHLEAVRKALSEGGNDDKGCEEIVYLMGDSTLDNKHWLFLDDENFTKYPSKEAFLLSNGPNNNNIVADAINGYEKVLNPPKMAMDVCYWMNKLATEGASKKVCTINAAVEESTVSGRSNNGGDDSRLLPQDEFVSKNIRPTDTLVVSMGGNDLALLPSEWTKLALQSLVASSHESIASGKAPGFDHILDIFHTQVEDFVARVIEGGVVPPKRIIVCALYYPDESSSTSHAGESWADPILEALGYSHDPTTVQLVLKSIYDHVEERGFRLPPQSHPTVAETPVVKLYPMFEVLDGKDHDDYVQRVEPSVIGGRKIARGLLDLIL